MSVPGDLPPMDTLFEIVLGPALPLPDRLSRIYGRLEFPFPGERAYVISNFVSSLDGVVALGLPGHTGGGEISGGNAHDHLVMGLLRAAVDAVIVGAGSLAASPGHLWTPQYIYPAFSDEFRLFRTRMGKAGEPLTVIVTSRGGIDLSLPVFQSADIPVAILTTTVGIELIATQTIPEWVRVISVKPSGLLEAGEIIETLARHWSGNHYLVEGGPHLLGEFIGSRSLDELYLTLAPQVAGRAELLQRPGLVSGRIFAPDNPIWGSLYSVKRADSHLFVRYGFSTTDEG